MKRLFSLLCLLMLAVVAYSVPARPGTFVVTQKDGTKITVELVGDEFCSYYRNVANGQKMYRASDGDLHTISNQQFAEMVTGARKLRASVEASRSQIMARNVAARNGQHKVGNFHPMSGSQKGLIILVNFSDKSMATNHTRSVFDDQFNKEGYTQNNQPGSLHDFFLDQSYGQFDLTFDVVGPVTLSKRMAYYGAPKTIEVDGETISMNDSYPATMAREACKLADSECDVDFSKYDWDKDGYVDQVLIIYAGYSQASGAPTNTIWPHEWDLDSGSYYGDGEGSLSVDGVIVNTYACANELAGTSGSNLNGIGAACHEFSHCLGYPDFYDTSYSGGVGMSYWDVMHGGSYNGPSLCGEAPAGYTAYERWMAGWIEPVELNDGKTITDMKPINDDPVAYIIYNDKNQDEYLLLENHYNDKWFKYLYYYDANAKGLFVTHVDYDPTAWSSNTSNNNPNHQRMTWIPANGSHTESSTSFKKQLFPGYSNVNSLTESSHTSCGGKWWTACSTGSTTLNHTLTEITYNSTSHGVSFLFDDGDPVDDGTRYTIHYVVGSGTMEDTVWTQKEFREKAILASAVGLGDYQFLGWSKTPVEKTTEAPTALLAAGTEMKLESDITLYAVYKYLYIAPANNGYQLVETITKDNDYLLVSSNEVGTAYCVDASALSDASADEVMGTEVLIVDNDGKPTIMTAPFTAVWNCEYVSGTAIKHLVNNSNYLALDNKNFYISPSQTNISWGEKYGLYTTVGLSKYYAHPGTDGVFSASKQYSTTDRFYAFYWTGAKPVTYYATAFSLLGDVNGDGVVDVADVNAVLSVIFSDYGYLVEADVNSDGVVDIADVNTILSIIYAN